MPNEAQDRMRIVIVGAGYAGLLCALRLARTSGSRALVTLINASESFVERIRLHQQALGVYAPRHQLADMVRDSGIQLHIGWVDTIDLQQRTVTVGGETIHWDRLVLALGSSVDLDRVPGVRELAYTFDESSARKLADQLPALAAASARVAVVGGGLTGVEAASELAETYPDLSVVLVTRGELVPGFSTKTRQHVRSALTRLGVELREHVSVSALRNDMPRSRASSTGTKRRADSYCTERASACARSALVLHRRSTNIASCSRASWWRARKATWQDSSVSWRTT